jgi:PRTRC genetic system protein C
MALQTQQLERTFRYNSVDLIDPGAQYTPEQVRDFYAPTYPEILNAAIEGPEEKDGKLRYTFRRAVGTKGVTDEPDLVCPACGEKPCREFEYPDAASIECLNKACNSRPCVRRRTAIEARRAWEALARDAEHAPASDVGVSQSPLLTGHSASLARFLLAIGAPKHVRRLEFSVTGDTLASVRCAYYPEEGPFEEAALVLADYVLVRRDAGVGQVALERRRQMDVEGYTSAHDDAHTDHSLAMAAAVYAAPEPVHVYRNPPDQFSDPWPWHPIEDKRKFADAGMHVPASAAEYSVEERVALLVKAGALIAAEIDRLGRASKVSRG